MGVTIKVNGTTNSVVHKGSNHFSAATMPDVCKTPSPGGPVPMPYPNVSLSSSLAKGSTTVKADGGNPVGIKGSEYSMSQGDEPGTAGGVKSSSFKKESSWISYSFDVKVEGKNVCRLTDKKFQNHENAADLGGDAGPPVWLAPMTATLCRFLKECTDAHDAQFDGGKPSKEWCDAPSGQPDETQGMARGNAIDACCTDKVRNEFFKPTFPPRTHVKIGLPYEGSYCYPDVAVLGAKPPQCEAVFDFKTSCPPLEPGLKRQWDRYGDGSNNTRKVKNEKWHGKRQNEVYKEASGAEPIMIHANSEACNS